MAHLAVRCGYLLVLILSVVVGSAANAAAQTATGAITGSVVDPQSAVVPGATATIINESTGDTRVATTDVRGDFQVTSLPPGQYTVRVELTSFRVYERKNVVLSA